MLSKPQSSTIYCTKGADPPVFSNLATRSTTHARRFIRSRGPRHVPCLTVGSEIPRPQATTFSTSGSAWHLSRLGPSRWLGNSWRSGILWSGYRPGCQPTLEAAGFKPGVAQLTFGAGVLDSSWLAWQETRANRFDLEIAKRRALTCRERTRGLCVI